MQTGVYNGWIMFPSGWVNFKLYEVGKYYTEIGFGAITWHGLTINTARWARLPKEVQDIMLEVAREYEAKTGTVNEENYPKQLGRAEEARRQRQASCRTPCGWNGRSRWRPGRREGAGTRQAGPARHAGAGDRARSSREGRPQVAGALQREVARGRGQSEGRLVRHAPARAAQETLMRDSKR